MKLVREFITLFEKFTEDSDAVQDMGIGMPVYIEQVKKDIIDRYIKSNGGGGAWFKPSQVDINRICTYPEITRHINRYYQNYGVDLSLAMLAYLSSNNFIKIGATYSIYTALERGKSIKKRKEFIEGLIKIGAKVKQHDINLSMGKDNDKMTQFLIETAMQQKRGKIVQKMLDMALKKALAHHKIEMILWLFDKGADPSLDKYAVLQWALANDETELVKEMLKHIQNDPKYQ